MWNVEAMDFFDLQLKPTEVLDKVRLYSLHLFSFTQSEMHYFSFDVHWKSSK